MAKIFIVLSILASIAAGYFGYMTYTKIGDVNTKLKDTRTALASTSAKLSTTQDKLTDAQTALTKAKSDLDTANATVQTTQAKLDDTTTQLTAAQAQVADLNDQIVKLKKLIPTNPNAPINPNDAQDPLQARIKELETQLSEAQLNVKTLQTRTDDAEGRLKTELSKEAQHAAIINHPGIEGLVMAVNPGYNFTVISIGDRQGAAPNAQVLVKRGDLLIAKMKITSVEPTTSIADIIPDSLAKGQHVLPGDKVIFTGLNAQ